MIAIRFAAIAALIASTAAPMAASAQDAGSAALSPDTIAQIDSGTNKAVTVGRVAGVSVAVARDGTIVYSRGYGFANVAHHVGATVQTHYEIGSITKQFTATAILQLKEQGKLSLSDTLARWIPEYKRGAAITIEELLSQTTGIYNYTEADGFEKMAGTQRPSFAKMLALVADKPLAFTPGSKFDYSNTNYILLGEIVERASGTSWENYVRTKLFAPAGMSSSGFISDEAKLQPMATGYTVSKKGIKLAPPLISGWAWSAGAIVSTVDDMQAWDSALLRGKLINRTDLAMMFSPRKQAFDKGSFYAFGWIVDTADGHKRIWHNGGTFGFTASNMLFPRDHLSIVVLQNTDSLVGPDASAMRIFEALVPSAVVASSAKGEDPAVTARIRGMIASLENGTLDRSQLTPDMNKMLTPQLLADVKTQFAPLGAPQQLIFVSKVSGKRGELYTYRAVFSAVTFNVHFGVNAAGKVAGFNLAP